MAVCIITIFPVGAFAFLSQIVFLPSSTRNQLNRFGNRLSISVAFHNQMDVVGGHRVV